MPTNTSFKFNGGSTQYMGGAIYVPTGAVDFAGGAEDQHKLHTAHRQFGDVHRQLCVRAELQQFRHKAVQPSGDQAAVVIYPAPIIAEDTTIAAPIERMQFEINSRVADTRNAMVARTLTEAPEFRDSIELLFTTAKTSQRRYLDQLHLPTFLRFTLRAFHTFCLRLAPGKSS
jgi:hypothetical protein